MGASFLSAISGKAAGILGRDQLFGAMLPVVIASLAWLGLLAVATGVPATLEVLLDRSAGELSLLTVALSLAALAASYVLIALRPLLVAFWSGSFWRLLPAGRAKLLDLQGRRLEKLAHSIERGKAVQEARRKLHTKIVDLRRKQGIRDGGRERTTPSEEDINTIDEIKSLDTYLETANEADAETKIKKVIDYITDETFIKHRGVAAALDQAERGLEAWITGGTKEEREARRRRSIEFPPRALVEPTRLGNLIAATDYYAYDRYGMEGATLLPRLAPVLPEQTAERLADSRLLLDFWLALASLAMFSSIAIAFVLPYFWLAPVFLLVCWVSSGLFTWLAYHLAVMAMAQLGEQTRAAYDLGRLKLLKELGLPEPASLADERQTWGAVSRLVVYGIASDISYVSQVRPSQ